MNDIPITLFVLKNLNLQKPEFVYNLNEQILDPVDDFSKQLRKKYQRNYKTKINYGLTNNCKRCHYFLKTYPHKKFNNDDKFPSYMYGYSQKVFEKFLTDGYLIYVKCYAKYIDKDKFLKYTFDYVSYNAITGLLVLILSKNTIKNFEECYIPNLEKTQEKHILKNQSSLNYKYLKDLVDFKNIDLFLSRLQYSCERIKTLTSLVQKMILVGNRRNHFVSTYVCDCDHIKNYILHFYKVPFWHKYTNIENIYWTSYPVNFEKLLKIKNHDILTKKDNINYPKVLGRLVLSKHQKRKRYENRKFAALIVNKVLSVTKQVQL